MSSKKTKSRKKTTAAASSAITAASSATTVLSAITTAFSATTVPSAITTASSSWIIQSPPSTLTPIRPGSPLNLNNRPPSYIETMRYLESNSRLKRAVQTTQETFTREMPNIEAVLSHKQKLLDEVDTERVKFELDIKRLQDDNEDLKSNVCFVKIYSPMLRVD
ncbi:lamin-C-like [Formica exsecta]|uniref:lamin-C-like n=1 Tax=Formica exsecta TaxID=72781 RepID=UPI001143857B|nr:lamin-C-like [Formica exsecta]